MSAADFAVQIFRKLEQEDFRVLQAIEIQMSRHEYVPESTIPGFANLSPQEVKYRLPRLRRLIRRWKGFYTGYQLNSAGYDCLAINALVKANVLDAFGRLLGVGKEADVYEALTPTKKRIAVKFHRLGRTSFRQTRRKRGYIVKRHHISWLYQSRLAAEMEYKALRLVYYYGISVPEPIIQNRHVVVMGIIEGVELVNCVEIQEPKEVLDEVLLNIQKTYLDAGIIHADLSEYNIILKPDLHVLIIDWPQFVKRDHPSANRLLRRDIEHVIRFFNRRFGTKTNQRNVWEYVTSHQKSQLDP
jgi:RIO kinase 2